MTDAVSIEDNFEEDIRLELAKLDSICRGTESLEIVGNEHRNTSSPASRRNRLYSVYELAEAEAEREELQDKLDILLSKTDEFDDQLLQMNKLNMSLKTQNKTLETENQRLKQIVSDLTPASDSSCPEISCTDNTECGVEVGHRKASLELKTLQTKNAELRARLTRMEKSYDDMCVAKDALVQELEHERMLRIHIEKERDAYSAAYEVSLQHFEKLTKSDVLNF